MATATTPHAAGIMGAAVPRIDGPLKTTGSARYSVDYDFPLLVHAVAVQSTIGKGRIRSLNVSTAEKMPGVLLVLHHGNIENVYRTFPHQQDGSMAETRPPFEDDQIYYWGQYVAVVVAETMEQANAAADPVRVDYDAESPDARPDLSEDFAGHQRNRYGRCGACHNFCGLSRNGRSQRRYAEVDGFGSVSNSRNEEDVRVNAVRERSL